MAKNRIILKIFSILKQLNGNAEKNKKKKKYRQNKLLNKMLMKPLHIICLMTTKYTRINDVHKQYTLPYPHTHTLKQIKQIKQATQHLIHKHTNNKATEKEREVQSKRKID